MFTKTYNHLILLFLISSVIAWFRIGDFQRRLSMQSSDDGPVAVAMYFQNPENFKNDIQQRASYASQIASLQNWLPAVLQKYAGVPAPDVAWVFTCFQTIGLGLAVWLIAFYLAQDVLVAWCAALCAMCFPVYEWNMANYGSILSSPYAGHLAPPICLFSLYYLLKGRRVWAVALNVLAGLVHPSYGVYTVGITLTYLTYLQIVQAKSFSLPTWIRSVWPFLTFPVLFLLPAIILQKTIPQLPDSVQYKSWFCNGHIFPFNGHYCKGPDGLIKSSGLMFVLSILAFSGYWSERRTFSQKGVAFLVAGVFAVLTFVALNYAAMVLVIWKLALLVPSRSSQLLVFISLAGLFILIKHLIQQKSLWRFGAVTLLLFYFSQFPWDRFYGRKTLFQLAALFAVAEILEAMRRTGRIRSMPFTRMAYVVFIVLLGRYILRRPMVGDIDWMLYSLIPVFALLALSAIPGRIQLPLQKAAFLYTFLFLCGLSLRREQIDADRPWLVGLRDAQIWARDNTQLNDGFVVMDVPAWRNLSQRPVVAFGAASPYGTPLFAVEYGKQVNAFVERQRLLYASKPTFKEYDDLSLEGFKNFAKQFGAKYAVRPVALPALDLPVGYRNKDFVIYRIE